MLSPLVERLRGRWFPNAISTETIVYHCIAFQNHLWVYNILFKNKVGYFYLTVQAEVDFVVATLSNEIPSKTKQKLRGCIYRLSMCLEYNLFNQGAAAPLISLAEVCQ